MSSNLLSVARRSLLAGVTYMTLFAASVSVAAAQNAPSADQIEHHIAKIDGTRFHYVTAGTGDPVLLPGWPESWIAYRKVVPLLVNAGRRVIVLDPRGLGESDKPVAGYDLDTAARDLHRFLEATNLTTAGGIDVVAHDVGTWIAHAHAVTYPADVKSLVLTEVFLPGLFPVPSPGLPSEAVNLKTWQFSFNRLNDLPEILVQGHEREYLSWIFATKATRSYAIEPAAIDEYTRQYSAPGAMRAGFAWYRANFDADGLAQAKARAGKRLTVPVLALGGSDGVGDALRATIAPVGDHVQGGAIAPRQPAGSMNTSDGCGHFLPEECPAEMTEAILKFWKPIPK
jgi:pimeloyl-ACP methyl ester carboxylesterase